MRIVSLLPSTTEIVCELGLESSLVGRSHQCDHPEAVRSLPACTSPKYDTGGTAGEIDRRVTELLRDGLSVYRVDAEKLASLEPDIILTQDHCEVCAASLDEVKEAAGKYLGDHVQIVSVSPTDLDGVFLSIQKIAEAVNAEEAGTELIQTMIDRFNELQGKTANLPAPRVVCIEWIDPLMTAGNWFPELVEVAGGIALLSEPGEHSARAAWTEVVERDPDLLLVAPCGYSIRQTRDEMGRLSGLDGWNSLDAVKNGRIFLMDGNRYFHRPGPGLADSARILAEIFHPGLFDPEHRSDGWITYTTIEQT